ncbi:hypothetical protein HYQ46_004217 [Verticillium longisporum]|nr:hypothetical protein HYQ46_004217 [Verticillium longisporum]
MERLQCHLCARLTNRLGANSSDSVAGLDVSLLILFETQLDKEFQSALRHLGDTVCVGFLCLLLLVDQIDLHVRAKRVGCQASELQNPGELGCAARDVLLD